VVGDVQLLEVVAATESGIRLAALASLLVLLGGCSPTTSAGPSFSAPQPSAASQPAVSRLGRFELKSPQGVPIGTISISEASPEAVIVDVTVSDVGIHPWGIYDQPDCAMPSPNHDSPFQFADIEDGHQAEQIEASSYLSYPPDLVALVFGADDGSVYGCALLGPPLVEARPSASHVDCGIVSPGPLGTGRPELALSRDVLGNAEIFVMRDNGTDPRRLTDSLGPDFKPSWSPDGQQIAFRTSRDGQDEIYVMNADGTCQRNLTQDPADDRSPAWSPDGKLIAFDHFFNDRFQDVTIIDIGGLAMRRVTTSSGEYPAWSPDGTKIAFASARGGDYDIYVIDADGINERRLTRTPGYDMYPAWSPDGEGIAYESGPDAFRRLQIHFMRADGTGDRALTSDEATNRFPAWSRDGRLAWSRDGTIVIAASPEATPVEVGRGQFPDWRP